MYNDIMYFYVKTASCKCLLIVHIFTLAPIKTTEKYKSLSIYRALMVIGINYIESYIRGEMYANLQFATSSARLHLQASNNIEMAKFSIVSNLYFIF